MTNTRSWLRWLAIIGLGLTSLSFAQSLSPATTLPGGVVSLEDVATSGAQVEVTVGSTKMTVTPKTNGEVTFKVPADTFEGVVPVELNGGATYRGELVVLGKDAGATLPKAQRGAGVTATLNVLWLANCNSDSIPPLTRQNVALEAVNSALKARFGPEMTASVAPPQVFHLETPISVISSSSLCACQLIETDLSITS